MTAACGGRGGDHPRDANYLTDRCSKESERAEKIPPTTSKLSADGLSRPENGARARYSGDCDKRDRFQISADSKGISII